MIPVLVLNMVGVCLVLLGLKMDVEPRQASTTHDDHEHSAGTGGAATASNISEPHEMRITDHGKIKNFVTFALKYLSVGIPFYSSRMCGLYDDDF
jgi:hypothetical protein